MKFLKEEFICISCARRYKDRGLHSCIYCKSKFCYHGENNEICWAYHEVKHMNKYYPNKWSLHTELYNKYWDYWYDQLHFRYVTCLL